MIIGVLNQKGGVGKTTLSVNLSAALSLMGKRTLLIDADPQGSALDWQASRKDESLFSVVGMAKPTLHKDLPDLASHYDAAVIDGPPRVNDLARSAIMASDIVLIPVQPSPYDVWAADEIVKLIHEISPFKDNLRCWFVINRKVSNSAIGRDVVQALQHYPFPVANSVITQRVIFAETAASGKSVLEQSPKGPSSKEIRALLHEILEA